jgi:DNA polymerase
MAASYQMDLDELPPLVLPRAGAEHQRKADLAWRRAFLSGEDYGLEPDTFRACHILNQIYRHTNAKINQLRYDIDHATKHAVQNPDTVSVVGRCKIWVHGTALIIELPSGRRLIYLAPRLARKKEVDLLTGEERWNTNITYATARGKTWRRERAWAGIFLNNMVQGIANDCLRAGILNVAYDTKDTAQSSRESTTIVLHVHDEIGVETPIGAYSVEQLVKAMTALPSWGEGLPIAAKGWHGPRYGKR